MRGGHGTDTALGDKGSDTLFASKGDDTLDGGPGFDRYFVNGDWGHDTISAPESDIGRDQLSVAYGSTKDVTIRLAPGPGPQVTDGTSTVEWAQPHLFIKVITGRGDITFVGDDIENRVITFNGDDQIYARAGNDRIQVGTGSDAVRAGDGDDTVYAAGDAGLDTIDCGPGDDTVQYDPATDTIANCEHTS